MTDPAAPPLLTGTFRPKELLRRVKTQNGDIDWEFAPVKVPEGISLRNFGIQVVCITVVPEINYCSYALLLFAAYLRHAFRYRRLFP